MPGPNLVLWMPWALLLSAVAAALGVRAARRRRFGTALRWAGWALVPPALLLTGTLRLVGRIGAAVLAWSASLALNPVTWLGIALGGTAVLLLAAARLLESRRPERPARPVGTGSSPAPPPAVDDDLAEIEELLRRRGIR